MFSRVPPLFPTVSIGRESCQMPTLFRAVTSSLWHGLLTGPGTFLDWSVFFFPFGSGFCGDPSHCQSAATLQGDTRGCIVWHLTPILTSSPNPRPQVKRHTILSKPANDGRCGHYPPFPFDIVAGYAFECILNIDDRNNVYFDDNTKKAYIGQSIDLSKNDCGAFQGQKSGYICKLKKYHQTHKTQCRSKRKKIDHFVRKLKTSTKNDKINVYITLPNSYRSYRARFSRLRRALLFGGGHLFGLPPPHHRLPMV